MPKRAKKDEAMGEYELVLRNVSEGEGTHVMVPVTTQKLRGRAAKKSTTYNRGQAGQLFGQPLSKRSGFFNTTEATAEEDDAVFGEADELDFDEGWIREMMAAPVDHDEDYVGPPLPDDASEEGDAFPTHAPVGDTEDADWAPQGGVRGLGGATIVRAGRAAEDDGACAANTGGASASAGDGGASAAASAGGASAAAGAAAGGGSAAARGGAGVGGGGASAGGRGGAAAPPRDDGIVRAGGKGVTRAGMRAAPADVERLLREYRSVGTMEEDDPRAAGVAPLSTLRPALVEFTTDVVQGVYPKLKRRWGEREMVEAVRPRRYEGMRGFGDGEDEEDAEGADGAGSEGEDAEGDRWPMRKPPRPSRLGQGGEGESEDEEYDEEDEEDEDPFADGADPYAHLMPQGPPPAGVGRKGRGSAADGGGDGEEGEGDEEDEDGEEGEDPFADMMADMDRFVEQRELERSNKKEEILRRRAELQRQREERDNKAAAGAKLVKHSVIAGMLKGADIFEIREREERRVTRDARAAAMGAVEDGVAEEAQVEEALAAEDLPGMYTVMQKKKHERALEELVKTEEENAARTVALVKRQQREEASGVEPTQVIRFTERKPVFDAETAASRRTVGVNVPTTIAPPRKGAPPRRVGAPLRARGAMLGAMGGAGMGMGLGGRGAPPTKAALNALRAELAADDGAGMTTNDRVRAMVGGTIGVDGGADEAGEAGVVAGGARAGDAVIDPVSAPVEGVDDGEMSLPSVGESEGDGADPLDYLGGDTWIGRRKDESKEEKKARKGAVKEENRLRRMQKAALKKAYAKQA